MTHKSFFWFVLPSSVLMLLFIALPIVSVVLQSVHAAHDQVIVTVENCGPFGCTETTAIDQEATRALREAEPMGRFVGLGIYTDRNHLAVDEVAASWSASETWREFRRSLFNLPF